MLSYTNFEHMAFSRVHCTVKSVRTSTCQYMSVGRAERKREREKDEHWIESILEKVIFLWLHCIKIIYIENMPLIIYIVDVIDIPFVYVLYFASLNDMIWH